MANLLYTNGGSAKLVAYCSHLKEEARTHYETHYKEKWENIMAHWLAEFRETLKTRKSERSKLINPTTQISVDTAAADLDAAIGFAEFFKVDPAFFDRAPENWEQDYAAMWDEMVKNFKKDFMDSGSRAEVSKAVFLGALLGAGVIKTVSEKKVSRLLGPGPNGDGVVATEVSKMITSLKCVNPHRFWPQPGADSLEDCGYVVEQVPLLRHEIVEKIRNGTYDDVILPAEQAGEHYPPTFEYHGLVPRKLLIEAKTGGVTGEEALIVDNIDDDDVVEALVIWVEGMSQPLYASETPYLDRERSYSTFGYDESGGGVFGRGVGHKVYNVQRAQDATSRAKLDALGYAVHPMIGINSVNLLHRRRMTVRPGQQLLFNGPPRESVEVFRFGDIPQSAFMASQELQQLADLASGGQTFGGANTTYQTAQGMEVLAQPGINRSRKILEALTKFLGRTIRQYLWRSTQYDPQRYPPVAHDFEVQVVTNSLTRHSEMAQISNMLKTLPDTSPAYWRLLIQYFKLSDLPEKQQVIAEVKQIAEAVLNPPQAQPTFEERLLLRRQQMEEKREAVSLQLQAERVRAELVRAAAALERIDSEEVRNKAAAILSMAKAESAEVGSQLATYKAMVEQLTAEAKGTDALYTEEFRATKLGPEGTTGGGSPQGPDKPSGVEDTGGPAPGTA